MDGSGSTLALANQFSNRGIVIERAGTSYRRITDIGMTEGIAAAAVSTDGKTIVLGTRTEDIAVWTRGDSSRFAQNYFGTLDSSCVRVSGPQHRVSAISFYGTGNANFLAATQEGCLAFFVKDVSGWTSQVVIDTQMPDVVAASVSPDSRWAALGTASGRIQIWDLTNLRRPPATEDARLPWSSTFAWLSPGESADAKWMIVGNSRFGPVASWLVEDNDNVEQSPTVLPIFPPTWIDKSGIVGVGAAKGSLLAATTDGRLLRLRNVDTPQSVVDRLIDRACEISSPLVRDAAYPGSTARTQSGDDAFVSEIMNWARKRCQTTPESTPKEAKR
jgi:WD40 repeat protein